MKQAFHNADSVEVARQRFLETGKHDDAEEWHKARTWAERIERHDTPEYMPDDTAKGRFVLATVLSVGMFVLGAMAGTLLAKTPDKNLLKRY
jgi:hypothetical protein